MQDIDIAPLIDAFVTLVRTFLIDIPTYFLDQTLSSGIFSTVWNLLMGNAQFYQVLFILAISAGAYKYSRSLNPESDIREPKDIRMQRDKGPKAPPRSGRF